jgi:hypothetical protein
MPRLILHIGDGKTGSSFLQYCFATHRDALAEAGVRYPHDASFEKAAQGLPTAGNAKELGRILNLPAAEAERELPAQIARLIGSDSGRDVLLSSEDMQAPRQPNLLRLKALAADAGYSILVVYYVRSVVGRAYSGYLQRVKRHGESGPFAEFATSFRYWPTTVVPMLEAALAAGEYVVRNFDTARSDIFRDFARAALPASCTRIEVEHRVVNRSLSPSQVAYARELNRHLTSDAQSTFAGHALMEGAEYTGRIVVTPQEVDILAKKFGGLLPSVNRHLPASEHVQVVGPGEVVGTPQDFTLSDAERNSILLLAALIRRFYPDA